MSHFKNSQWTRDTSTWSLTCFDTATQWSFVLNALWGFQSVFWGYCYASAPNPNFTAAAKCLMLAECLMQPVSTPVRRLMQGAPTKAGVSCKPRQLQRCAQRSQRQSLRQRAALYGQKPTAVPDWRIRTTGWYKGSQGLQKNTAARRQSVRRNPGSSSHLSVRPLISQPQCRICNAFVLFCI